MLAHSVGLSTILYLVAVSSAKAELSVKNNAFQNVRVSFAPNVSPEDGRSLIQNMQDLLRNTSRTLHTAAGYRIGSVSFYIPDTWDVSDWPDTVQTHSGDPITGDLVIDGTSGNQVLAVQYGGCGVEGLSVTVTVQYLQNSTEDEYPKDKQLAREWIKYRYGVFEENGLQGDELYPSHYTVPGSDSVVKITECTHPKVDFELKDLEGETCSDALLNQTCFPQPKLENTTDVKSSLMFFHEKLPQVAVVCGRDGHEHNSDTYSKHNTLCEGKSVWDVINQSPDYDGYKDMEWVDEDIQFSFLQEPKPRIILALERTVKLEKQSRPIVFAIHRLWFDLSGRAKTGAYRVTKTSEVLQEFGLKNLETSELRIGYFIDEETEVCTSCALHDATEALLKDSTDIPGHIILITASALSPDYDLDNLKSSQLCVTIIIFAASETEGKELEESYADLIKLSCSSTSVLDLKQNEQGKTFDAINSLMRSHLTLQPSEDVAEKEENVGIMTKASGLTFSMDDRAQVYTLWFDRFVGKEEVKCNLGNSYAKLTKGSDTKSISSLHFEAWPEKGEINCVLTHEVNEPLTQVMMQTKPGHYFTADVWTTDTTKNETHQMPVIIYFKLEFNHLPVFDAQIKATVQSEGGQEILVHLFDNGRGDPDITQNDGIYSGYFLDFVEADSQKYTVKVTATKDSSETGKKNSKDCCGSNKINGLSSHSITNFEKIERSTTFTTEKKPPTGYPPSRINDLRAKIESPGEVLLTWTSPGNGKASSYKLSVHCDLTECRGDGTLPPWLYLNMSEPTPKAPGESEKAILHLTPAESALPSSVPVTLAIASLSSDGQTGKSSNKATAELRPVVIITRPSSTQTPVIKGDADRAGLIIGAVIIAVTLTCCLIGVVYALVKRRRAARRRHPEFDKCPENLNGTERSGSFRASKFGVQPMKRVQSFPVILYTHDQLKDFKKDNRDDPPLYKPPGVPKQWASVDVLRADSGDRVSEEMKQVDQVSVQSGERAAEPISRF